jgi:hypothetical protein
MCVSVCAVTQAQEGLVHSFVDKRMQPFVLSHKPKTATQAFASPVAAPGQERQAQQHFQQQREGFQAQTEAAAALIAAGHPPPMTEAQCKQMVYQHVLWLQQRHKATDASNEPQAPVADNRDKGDKQAARALEGAAKAPAKAGKDAAENGKEGQGAKDGAAKDIYMYMYVCVCVCVCKCMCVCVHTYILYACMYMCRRRRRRWCGQRRC